MYIYIYIYVCACRNTPTWIPLIDMVNCIESHDKTFIQYDTSLQAAVMYADRPTPKGVQVHVHMYIHVCECVCVCAHLYV